MNSSAGTSTYNATDGAAYEKFLGRWTRALALPLIEFAEFPEDGPLLDVGCGTGSAAHAMATRWPARGVLGLDIASPYISFAKSQYNLSNLKFEVADATDLSSRGALFAGAVAQLVLNFIPDPSIALMEMRRVIVPGGRIVAAVWDFRGGLVYQRMFWDTAAGIDPGAAKVRDKLFSGPLALPDGLTKLFESTGLESVERTSITVRMDYENFDDYWQPMCTGQGPVGTYLMALTPTLRGRIQDAVIQSYRSGAPDGPRSLTATAWAVRGRVRGN